MDKKNSLEENKYHSKKVVRTFAAASFLNDMGSDIIYPIWPLFVTEVLKANMTALGFLDGLGNALVSISKAASGYFSDRLKKRKAFIWIGYLFGAFSRIGYAFSSVWTHLIPFRILDRGGKIRGAPRDAYIADVSTQKNRGKILDFSGLWIIWELCAGSLSVLFSFNWWDTGFFSPLPRSLPL